MKTNLFLTHFDNTVIAVCKRFAYSFARFALFLVYFWFGILKVITESPANPLVDSLLQRTLPFMSFETFILLFGLLEVLIGILFLFPKMTRLVISLLFLHMITTFMPLVFLPQLVWTAPFVPTLEGQYIIKNVLIIAVALEIVSHLHPHLPQSRKSA